MEQNEESIKFEAQDSYINHRSDLILMSIVGLVALTVPLLFVVWLGMVLYKVITYSSFYVKISNYRIVTHSGILVKTINSLELWRIKDIQVQQSILQRPFGECVIVLSTQDVSSPTIYISCIKFDKADLIVAQMQKDIFISRNNNKVTSLTQ